MPAWSRDEVELIVADYFAMLRAELSGKRVNKAEHNRHLRARLDNRSKQAVEFTRANISAVLLNLGSFPYIDGYKPRSNYQQLLEQAVLERLLIEPDFFEGLSTGPVMQPTRPAQTDFSRVGALIEEAPKPAGEAGIHLSATDRSTRKPVPRKTDFVRLDAENRRLGRLGEAWAHEFEARRLVDVEKRPDLARQIVWVSQSEGDGAGYDIRSFNRDGSPRLIEVKATGHGKHFPFYVSPNEVAVSQREATKYFLYRVFSFATDPRVYMLHGALSAVCRLEPAQYSARLAR
jgi:hypothetical protein